MNIKYLGIIAAAIIIIAGISIGIYTLGGNDTLVNSDESLSTDALPDEGKQFTIKLQDGITTESQP
ncbi:MAG: hypothetical protein K5785_04765 [Nitrosarchaeum sp.]|nr:hypothetical protein [Nitrosarchaeum sp.]